MIGSIHGILGLFCLGSLFVSLTNGCRSLFFTYFFVYSLGGFSQTLLEYKLPRMNLFDAVKALKIKRIISVLLVPVAAHLFLSIMFWARSPTNPIYCMFCLELKLPSIIGLPITIHAFIGFVLWVQVGYAYTKRKYFLLSIGGPQNEVIRDRQGNVIDIRLPIIPANQDNMQYQDFDDRHE